MGMSPTAAFRGTALGPARRAAAGDHDDPLSRVAGRIQTLRPVITNSEKNLEEHKRLATVTDYKTGQVHLLTQYTTKEKDRPVTAVATAVLAGIMTLGLAFADPGMRNYIAETWSGRERTYYSGEITAEERAHLEEHIAEKVTIRGHDDTPYNVSNQAQRCAFAEKEYEQNPSRFMNVRGKGLYLIDPQRSRVIVVPQAKDGNGFDFDKTESYTITDSTTGKRVTDTTRLEQTAYQLVLAQGEIEAGLLKAKEGRIQFLTNPDNTRKYLDKTTAEIVAKLGWRRTEAMLNGHVNSLQQRVGDAAAAVQGAQNPVIKKALTEKLNVLKADLKAAQTQKETLHDRYEQLNAAMGRYPGLQSSDEFLRFNAGEIGFLNTKIDEANNDGDQEAADVLTVERDAAIAQLGTLLDGRFRNWKLDDEGVPQFVGNVAARSPLGQSMLIGNETDYIAIGEAQTLHDQGVAFSDLSDYIKLKKAELDVEENDATKQALEGEIQAVYGIIEAIFNPPPPVPPHTSSSVTPVRPPHTNPGYEGDLIYDDGATEPPLDLRAAQLARAYVQLSKLSDDDLSPEQVQKITIFKQTVSEALVNPQTHIDGAMQELETLRQLEAGGALYTDELPAPGTPEHASMQLLQDALAPPPVLPPTAKCISSFGRLAQLQLSLVNETTPLNFWAAHAQLRAISQIEKMDLIQPKQDLENLEARAQTIHPQDAAQIDWIQGDSQGATRYMTSIQDAANNKRAPIEDELAAFKGKEKAFIGHIQLLGRYENACVMIKKAASAVQDSEIMLLNNEVAEAEQLIKDKKALAEQQAEAGALLGQLFHSYPTDAAGVPETPYDLELLCDHSDACVQLKEAMTDWKPTQIVLDKANKQVRVASVGLKWNEKKSRFELQHKLTSSLIGLTVINKDNKEFWERFDEAYSKKFVDLIRQESVVRGGEDSTPKMHLPGVKQKKRQPSMLQLMGGATSGDEES